MAETERTEGQRDSVAKLAALLAPLALAKIVPFGWGRLTPLIRSSIKALRKSPMEPYVQWLEDYPGVIPVSPMRQRSPYAGMYYSKSEMGPRIELDPIEAIAEALAKKPAVMAHEFGHGYVDLSRERVPAGVWGLLKEFEPSMVRRMSKHYFPQERNEEALIKFLEGSLPWTPLGKLDWSPASSREWGQASGMAKRMFR